MDTLLSRNTTNDMRKQEKDSAAVAAIRAKHERSMITRRLREQIDSLRDAVEDRDEQLRELRESTQHTALLEVETAKEECDPASSAGVRVSNPRRASRDISRATPTKLRYYAEVLRLRQLLARKGAARPADMWDDGFGRAEPDEYEDEDVYGEPNVVSGSYSEQYDDRGEAKSDDVADYSLEPESPGTEEGSYRSG